MYSRKWTKKKHTWINSNCDINYSTDKKFSSENISQNATEKRINNSVLATTHNNDNKTHAKRDKVTTRILDDEHLPLEFFLPFTLIYLKFIRKIQTTPGKKRTGEYQTKWLVLCLLLLLIRLFFITDIATIMRTCVCVTNYGNSNFVTEYDAYLNDERIVAFYQQIKNLMSSTGSKTVVANVLQLSAGRAN